jgi:hypothetical protein
LTVGEVPDTIAGSSMMSLIGRLTTTGSSAALPAAVVFLGVMLATFKECGPQSRGLPAFAVPSSRPSWIPVGIPALSMAAAVGLFFLILSRT